MISRSGGSARIWRAFAGGRDVDFRAGFTAAEKPSIGNSGVETPEGDADAMSCLKARPTKLSDSALAAVAAAIVFTAFHAAGATGQAPALLASTILLNGIFGVGLGVLYARYGLESLVLCAAIGHLLAVSLASFRR